MAENAAGVFRLYTPAELGPDGYPPEWHATIKHAVRSDAGNRCLRCGHPYAKGDGEWSRCDEGCNHGGPARLMHGEMPPQIIGGDSSSFNAGRQVAYELSTGPCVDPASGRILPPLRVEARWRILTVHHLDGDKANCRWWNLVALCQRCHLQVQGRVVMARVWPWEHSEWFRSYVAGYYAHAYLGEDLTRDEVVARLDELLGLERAA